MPCPEIVLKELLLQETDAHINLLNKNININYNINKNALKLDFLIITYIIGMMTEYYLTNKYVPCHTESLCRGGSHRYLHYPGNLGIEKYIINTSIWRTYLESLMG